MASTFLSPTARATRRQGALRARARHPHSPRLARAGGHWPCWSEPPARWSRELRAGCGGGESEGQKSQRLDPLPATCPLPGPTGCPNTRLTSWRGHGRGELGSRHHGNRLRTAQGHLWERGDGEAPRQQGASISNRFPDLPPPRHELRRGLGTCSPWRPRGRGQNLGACELGWENPTALFSLTGH